MATLAVAPEVAAVHIVRVMTADTGAGKAHLLLHGVAMAGMAVDALVFAVQLVTGTQVVVEIPVLPVARVVAGFTLRPEA